MSNIPAGYKRTEVGVIPDDWEVVLIGAVLQIRHGKSQKDIIQPSGKYPILATGGEIEQDFATSESPAHLVNMEYRGVIGSVDEFEPAVWALAVKHAVPYAGKVVVVADGAQWIWRLVSDLFPICTQILDYYHAKQQLAQATHDCFPDDEKLAQSWFKKLSKYLFQGEIWKIITQLRSFQHNAGYFIHQQRRMQYQSFRAQGFPIGSGAVESAIKQFKHRLTGAGMRWSRRGAEHMVTVRASVMAGNLQQLWQQGA